MILSSVKLAHEIGAWIRAEEIGERQKLRRRLHVHCSLVISAGALVVCAGFALVSQEIAVFVALLADAIREIIDYLGGW